MTITPSDQQLVAIKAVLAWFKSKPRKPFFYLGGFAGVGKTYLAKIIAEEIGGDVVYAAFTGKAALVLRSKGCSGASTIHSLIYKAKEDVPGVPEFVLNRDSDVKRAKLVIIDEASMVGEDLGQDLMSFGTPVLVLGDPAQLPPVQGEGYFTNGDPDFMLTEIHRQAAESPIIQMSMIVREGGQLQVGEYGESRVISGSAGRREVLAADQMLAGRNKTRTNNNLKYRGLRGIDAFWPVVGERLVCLKNNKEKGLLNGGLWSVAKILSEQPDFIKMIVEPLDAGMVKQAAEVKVHRAFFNGTEKELPWQVLKDFDQMTFGYCLTVHKAQGSQWDNVVLYDESWVFKDDRARHLYTGITRAAERITVVA